MVVQTVIAFLYTALLVLLLSYEIILAFGFPGESDLLTGEYFSVLGTVLAPVRAAYSVDIHFIAGIILLLLAVVTAIGCFRKKSRVSYILSLVSFIVLLLKFSIDFVFVILGGIANVFLKFMAINSLFLLGASILDAVKISCLILICFVMALAMISLLTKGKKFPKVMRIFAILCIIPVLLGFGIATLSSFVAAFPVVASAISAILSGRISLSLIVPGIILPAFSWLLDTVTAALVFAMIYMPVFVVCFRVKEINKPMPVFVEPAGLLSESADCCEGEDGDLECADAPTQP